MPTNAERIIQAFEKCLKGLSYKDHKTKHGCHSRRTSKLVWFEHVIRHNSVEDNPSEYLEWQSSLRGQREKWLTSVKERTDSPVQDLLNIAQDRRTERAL